MNIRGMCPGPRAPLARRNAAALARASLAVAIAVVIGGEASAQTVFKPDLDDGASWTVVQDPDSSATFGFDYSDLGIPPAPGGEGTFGLRLAANMELPAEAAAISVTPQELSVTGRYSVQVDFWVNYNIDLGLVGTTEFLGAFVGFDASLGSPFDGAGFLGDSDGDTSRDYRLYKDGDEQFPESGQYSIPSQNNSDPALQAQFPGQETPPEQVDPANFDPPNQQVRAPDGTLAFAWHTLAIDVDSEAGTAAFSIDDFPIGTVDGNIGAPVALSGGIALTFADLFSSISANPVFSFGVFDNLVVTLESQERRLLRSDCNADGAVDVTDPISNLGFQFVGSFEPPCRDACDFNDDGIIDITDPIANLTHQFLGGLPPPPPGKDLCGPDPTEDALACESFPWCDGGV